MQFPKLRLEFDDGRVVEVQPKPRDMARAEMSGVDLEKAGPAQQMYAVAFAALNRQVRSGDVDGVGLPVTFEAFLDSVDVAGEVDAPGEPVDAPAASSD